MTPQNSIPPSTNPVWPELPGVIIPFPSAPEPLRPYTLSPPVVFIIGALGSIFLVIGYYQVMLKYCSSLEHVVYRRTTSNRRSNNTTRETHETQQVSSTGLDPSIIARIPIRPYNTKDADLSTECSVCLAEFRDGNAVRILPKCGHVFHVPCIGIWLHGQPTCPVCRADVAMAFFDLIPDSSCKRDQRLRIESRDRPNLNEISREGNGSARSLRRGENELENSQWYRRFVWSRRVNTVSRMRLYRGEPSDINGVNGPPSQDVVVDLNEASRR